MTMAASTKKKTRPLAGLHQGVTLPAQVAAGHELQPPAPAGHDGALPESAQQGAPALPLLYPSVHQPPPFN
jgi:hypothetical protein